MLPRVRELEERFGDVLVAIGVHAGKYTAERKTQHIAAACLRLGIEHPVVNDRHFRIWRAYTVQAWPTLTFLDPNGYVVASQAGELPLRALETLLERLIEGSQPGVLDRRPFELARPPVEPESGVLRFPGKVLAFGGRLYVADTGHHRVLEVELERQDDSGPPLEKHWGPRARVARAFGSGEAGFADGSAGSAAFREPQGMAAGTGALFVADRGNHAVRRVELETGRVSTVAGTGELGERLREGAGRETALRSPWALWLEQGILFIAMAGSHQIWKLDLATGRLRVHAGSGAESIEDGPLARATLAQPSGLAASDGRLYFADAESSSIRWADLREDGRVGTIVGTGLFDFGDRDGSGEEVRLQHPLDLAWHEGGLLVADSYNNKLKRVDPIARTAVRWPGGGAASLNEPAGLAILAGHLYVADTGNHRIVRAGLKDGAHEVLQLDSSEQASSAAEGGRGNL